MEQASLMIKDHEAIDHAQSILTYGKNDIVFRQGDTADHWYEVLSGAVRTCHFRIDGHRQLTGFHFVGDVIGVESGRYEVTAEAITNVTLKRCNAVSQAVQPEHLARALSNAQQYIALFGRRSASERLAAFILGIARRPAVNGRVALPMPRTDIADHLGLTIHTVSRTMSDFVRRQIVAPDGRQQVRIINQEKLAELAGETDFEGSRL